MSLTPAQLRACRAYRVRNRGRISEDRAGTWGTAHPPGLTDEKGLILAVFYVAMDDLRHRVECTCEDIEVQSPRCFHAYRTARRFLLGTRRAWREHRDRLCRLIGRDPASLEAQAMRVLLKRKGREVA